MAKLGFMGILLALITALGCKKDEPTSWDTEIAAPIAIGRLDLGDLVEDSLLAENPDGSLSIAYSQKILELVIDSLVEIPGDTLENIWSLPVSLEVPANTLIFSEEDEFEFTNSSASLSSATLRDGDLNVFITNEIESEIVVEYIIPEAIKGGEAFSIDVLVPASVGGQPGSVDVIFDIAGYTLDLTGEEGFSFNTLKTVTNIRSSSSAGAEIIANQEVRLQTIYQSLSVSNAVGYFNTTQTSFNGSESTFNEFSALYEAILSLESATAQLNLVNGFGADIRAILGAFVLSNSFSQVSVALDNNAISSPVNLTRAILTGGTLIPSQQSILLTPQNSNIVPFIEVLGDSITYSGSATLNPLGNISNFNDFIVEESRLDIELELDIPLNFSITSLVLKDTIGLSFDSEGVFPVEMDLYMLFENAFPISLEVSALVLDESGITVLNLNDYLSSGSAVIGGRPITVFDPQVTVLKYELDAEAVATLRASASIAVTAAAETMGYPERVVFRANEGIDISISTKANIRVQ